MLAISPLQNTVIIILDHQELLLLCSVADLYTTLMNDIRASFYTTEERTSARRKSLKLSGKSTAGRLCMSARSSTRYSQAHEQQTVSSTSFYFAKAT